MITTLKKAIRYFKLDDFHFNNRIDKISKSDNPNKENIIEELISIRDNTCTNSEVIVYVLQHISYHKMLLKYDIIDANSLDVIIHYEDKQTETW